MIVYYTQGCMVVCTYMYIMYARPQASFHWCMHVHVHVHDVVHVYVHVHVAGSNNEKFIG